VTYEVLKSEQRFSGKIISVRTDTVRMPDGSSAPRDVVEHPGAVGAVAIDADRNVLLIKQYRHAVGAALWEVPAGIRDVDGEDPAETAKRELHEETGYVAETVEPLCSVYATPGGSDERYEVYLASGVTEAAERPDVVDEEQDLEVRWVPLRDACEWVFDGTITNAMCALGVLAAARRLGI
jgi:ADP-ribose pyrophosphatase